MTFWQFLPARSRLLLKSYVLHLWTTGELDYKLLKKIAYMFPSRQTYCKPTKSCATFPGRLERTGDQFLRCLCRVFRWTSGPRNWPRSRPSDRSCSPTRHWWRGKMRAERSSMYNSSSMFYDSTEWTFSSQCRCRFWTVSTVNWSYNIFHFIHLLIFMEIGNFNLLSTKREVFRKWELCISVILPIL